MSCQTKFVLLLKDDGSISVFFLQISVKKKWNCQRYVESYPSCFCYTDLINICKYVVNIQVWNYTSFGDFSENLFCESLFCEGLFCEILFCESLFCESLFCEILFCEGLFCESLFCEGLFCEGLFCESLFVRAYFWGLILWGLILWELILWGLILWELILRDYFVRAYFVRAYFVRAYHRPPLLWVRSALSLPTAGSDTSSQIYSVRRRRQAVFHWACFNRING